MRFAETKIPDDCEAVLDAAAALDIREIDFFRLAFRRWFGRDIRQSALERLFADYMFRNVVPHWTRHLSRQVLARAGDGEPDGAEFGALKYLRQPPAPRHGRLYAGLTAAVIVLYCVALLNVSYDPETSAPIPCYGGPGFKLFAAFAHGISGKAPPTCEAANPRPPPSSRATAPP